VHGARPIIALAVLLVLAVGSAAAAPPAFWHAALRAASSPRAAGTFVATFHDRALSWQLTFDGVGRTARSARLRARSRSVVLCSPCTSGATGKTQLPAAVAVAARSGFASVAVDAGGALIVGALRGGVVPTLQLPALADGMVVRLPARVASVVSGVDRSAIRVELSLGGRTYRFAIASGGFTLPDDKFLSGRRDLTFVLADTDGRLRTNPEARVTIYGVYLIGRR
jgi:hypothetical protein